MKELLRNIFLNLRLDVTKNIKYDRLTREVIKKAVREGDVCVDVGCHKGEILDLFIQQSNANHIGFEPIPSFYNNLKKKYPNHQIYNFALSNKEGETTFQYVKNAPAYSGLKNRVYATKNPDIEEIHVAVKTLDQLIKSPVSFLKIDVEGAELLVLEGAEQTINNYLPFILFECGLGASEFYETTPQNVFDFFDSKNYHLFLLEDWLKNKSFLSREAFIQTYQSNCEYYFFAVPSKRI